MKKEEIEQLIVTEENFKTLGVAKKYIGLTVAEANAEKEVLKKKKIELTRVERLEKLCCTLIIPHDDELLSNIDTTRGKYHYRINFHSEEELLTWIEDVSIQYNNAIKEQ